MLFHQAKLSLLFTMPFILGSSAGDQNNLRHRNTLGENSTVPSNIEEAPLTVSSVLNFANISYPFGEQFKVKITDTVYTNSTISSSHSQGSDLDGEDRRGLQQLSCDDPDILCGGWKLNPGGRLTSKSGQFHVEMQSDGNFVVYRQSTTSRTPLWNANTFGTEANKASMQSDGNLVVYADTSPKWASQTSSQPGNWLRMQDDGNLVVYGSTGTSSPRWASGTSGGGGSGGTATDNPWLVAITADANAIIRLRSFLCTSEVEQYSRCQRATICKQPGP